MNRQQVITDADPKLPHIQTENSLPTINDEKEGTESQKDGCDETCGYRRAVFRFLVVAQFVIAITMSFVLGSPWYQPAGVTLVLGGVGIGVWAILSMDRKTVNISPELRSEANLVVAGPYRFVRHPMYTGLLMFCGAFAISRPTWLGLQLWISLLVILFSKSTYEEGMLRRRFKSYEEYASRVKRFIPFVL